MTLIPPRDLFNLPNIALIGFSAFLTIAIIHLLTKWAENEDYL